MTLLTSVLMGASHLYLIWRLSKASAYLTSGRLAKTWPWILMLSFYALPLTGLGIYVTSGEINMLEMPQILSYWYWFGLVFSIQLLTAILLLDVLKLLTGRYYHVDAIRLNSWYAKAAILMTAAVFAYTAIKMIADTNRIKTETLQIQAEGWPESLDGLKLVHISDIQGDQYTGMEEIGAYVEAVNQLDPALVIFTGDLISYGTDYIRQSAEEMGKIKSEYGTYAVVGDHDYWAGLSNIEPALEQNGIALLRNENRFIPLGSDSLLITGITQVYSQRAAPETVRNLTGAASQDLALKVLASHQISGLLLDEAREKGYQLLLAGHTHGGQVRIPIFGFTFSASDLETDYVSGSYCEDGLLISINNGLGFTLAPVRYNARPSVTEIIISARQR